MVRWRYAAQFGLLAAVSSSLEGCKVIGGIFKAGVWVGVIAAVMIVALMVGIGRVFSHR